MSGPFVSSDLAFGLGAGRNHGTGPLPKPWGCARPGRRPCLGLQFGPRAGPLVPAVVWSVCVLRVLFCVCVVQEFREQNETTKHAKQTQQSGGNHGTASVQKPRGLRAAGPLAALLQFGPMTACLPVWICHMQTLPTHSRQCFFPSTRQLAFPIGGG